MDDEVAKTLGELERKLLELEQTLSALGGEQSGEPAPPPVQPAADSREPPPPPVQPGVDPGEPPPPVHHGSDPREPPPPPVQPAAEPPTEHIHGRIVDETIEPPSAGRPGYQRAARVPQPSTQPAELPASPRANAQARSQTPPPPAAPPTAAELLRFRERLEQAARELTHDYDELLGRLSFAAVPVTSGPTISFARGAPSLDIIDVEALRDAAVRAFESDPAGATAYGTSVGYPRLRSWIADKHGVEPERVLVTNGSMQADAFLFEHLVRPGDEVIVERPSYDRTLLSLRQRGARLHPVELQPDGIDTDVLARLLGSGPGARPKLAHIIPNFQNPAGYTLSLDKRRALLELAREHDFVVFEDDPYVELRFSGESLPTMLSMDPERVVYASSFSKTICPGTRVGYLVGPPDLIGAIAQLATNTYISPNMLAQAIVYEFCASGAIERSIETVKEALAERAETLARALRSELPEAQFVPPQGGYFLWVKLPPEADVAALYHAAAERGVSFVKGTDFVLDGGENTLRLAYSGVTPAQIETGVARLAEAYRSL
ncbi:MAG: putative transcriptional regulator, GntR family [Solirubrobacterales bacterium]|nr:putative transcriptional regulator, GntR family [Solirubrobacterales bacterium]